MLEARRAVNETPARLPPLQVVDSPVTPPSSASCTRSVEPTKLPVVIVPEATQPPVGICATVAFDRSA